MSCVDDMPVAVNDSATVTEDDAATAINVLANDTDVDGGPEADRLGERPRPRHRRGRRRQPLGLTYQPDANYCNDGAPPDDTFTYTLNGGSQATVSVDRQLRRG